MRDGGFDALKAGYRRLRVLYFISLMAAVLALVLFFVNRQLTLAVLGASLLYYLLAVRPQNRAYARAYIHTAALASLSRHLQGAEHTPQPVLDPQDLRKAQLLAANRDKGGALCREGGRGTWRGRPVELGDVTFAHSFPAGARKRHEFVVGLWVTVTLDHDTGLDWRLLEERIMLPASREVMYAADQTLVQLEGFGPPWTERGWVMVHRENTPRLPPPDTLKAIRTLAEGTEHAVAVCVQGDRLHIFLTNMLLGQKVGARLPPQEAWVMADRLPELDAALAISDTL